MAKILITGGSGLIGRHLSKLLTDAGHKVVHLSRSPGKKSAFKTYQWNLNEGKVDERALEDTDHIVHLAGADLADKRWTKKQKLVILKSRTDSISLLHKYVTERGISLKSFVSASGTSYYGMDTGDRLLNEDAEPGEDFLAEVVKAWEREADRFSELTSVTKIRTGMVLSDQGGALPILARPVRWCAGAPFGTGKQYVSWIHIEDLCRIYQFVLEKKIAGVYNAVAPNPVTNEKLTKTLAKVLHRPLFLPNLPATAMKLVLGQKAKMVLGGNKVLGKRIQQKGFAFKFCQVEESVKNLLSK